MRNFQPDYLIVGDLLYNSQMHDLNNVTARLAAQSYMKNTGREVTMLAFPQQNKSASDPKHVYSFNQQQLMEHGAMRVYTGDKGDIEQQHMKAVKDAIRDNYMENWTDGLLFYKYAFEFGLSQARASLVNEYLRVVPNEDVAIKCPPRGVPGYEVLSEENWNHMGFEHYCERDWKHFDRFKDHLSKHPLTAGPIEPFDPSLWKEDWRNLDKPAPKVDERPLVASAGTPAGAAASAADRIAAIKKLNASVDALPSGSDLLAQVAKDAAAAIVSNKASTYRAGESHLGDDGLVYKNGNLRDYVSRNAFAVLVKCAKKNLDVSPYIRDILMKSSAGDVPMAAMAMEKLGIRDDDTVSALAFGMRFNVRGSVSDESTAAMLDYLAKVGADNKEAHRAFVWALDGGVKYANLSSKGFKHGGYVALQNINAYVKKHGIAEDMRGLIAAALEHAIKLEEKDRTGIDSMIAKDYVELVVRFPNDERMLPSARTLLALLQKNESATGTAIAQLDKSLAPLSKEERLQLCQLIKRNFSRA